LSCYTCCSVHTC